MFVRETHEEEWDLSKEYRYMGKYLFLRILFSNEIDKIEEFTREILHLIFKNTHVIE